MSVIDNARTPGGSALTQPRIVDRFEQVATLVLYFFLVERVFPHKITPAELFPLLLLVSEGLVVLFLIIRRPTESISRRPLDWVVAFAGTFAPLLVIKTATPQWIVAGAALMSFGLVIHVFAKLSLRRSFGLVAANRGVKSDGAYRYVRHPMYLGYILSHAGFLCLAPHAWNFAVYAVAWTCIVFRILAEERVLGADAAYQAYAARVRWRLLPGLF